ncbi:sugar phosphate isomerase/epimerase family protein [Halobaculum litoreum]|uniref:Sugar phosphate isomerase/epimerase family protein n=1 Tax=Halobaculum litoreum TaxID=3031998 RepID=A0ABD5XY81_9EURY
MRETGVEAAAAHVGLDAIESDPDGVADTYRALGCTDVVVPWLGPDHFASREAVADAGARLAAAADALADRGCSLHYHNHDQEFVDVDGETGLDRLLAAAPTVGLEPDLGWAGVAGADPLALLDRYAERVDLVHLKDYDADAGEPAPVGEGDLDLDTTVSAVREHGVSWLVYEAEATPDSYDALERAERCLDRYW